MKLHWKSLQTHGRMPLWAEVNSLKFVKTNVWRNHLHPGDHKNESPLSFSPSKFPISSVDLTSVSELEHVSDSQSYTPLRVPWLPGLSGAGRCLWRQPCLRAQFGESSNLWPQKKITLWKIPPMLQRRCILTYLGPLHHYLIDCHRSTFDKAIYASEKVVGNRLLGYFCT